MKDKKLKDTLENIIAYRQDRDGITLSDNEQDLDNKLDYADNIIREYTSFRRCGPMLKKKFPGISTSTAWRIYTAAKYVHGSLGKYDKDYERMVMADKYIELVNKMWNVNPVKYAKNIIAALNGRVKVLGLADDDTPQINPEDLMQHNYIMLLNLPENAQALKLNMAHKLPENEKQKLFTQLIELDEYSDFEEIDK